jgi:hypothetical protein
MERAAECNCGETVVVDLRDDESGRFVDCPRCNRNFWVEAPQSNSEKLYSIAVRVVALLIPATGFIVSARCWSQQFSTNGESTKGFTFWASSIAFALFGVPGIYLAIKGPLRGGEASVNRRIGRFRVVVGIGLLAVAGVVNFGLLSIAKNVGFVWILWTGGLGVGSVLTALGLLEILCGRNLVDELSSIEFGPKK